MKPLSLRCSGDSECSHRDAAVALRQCCSTLHHSLHLFCVLRSSKDAIVCDELPGMDGVRQLPYHFGVFKPVIRETWRCPYRMSLLYMITVTVAVTVTLCDLPGDHRLRDFETVRKVTFPIFSSTSPTPGSLTKKATLAPLSQEDKDPPKAACD